MWSTRSSPLTRNVDFTVVLWWCLARNPAKYGVEGVAGCVCRVGRWPGHRGSIATIAMPSPELVMKQVVCGEAGWCCLLLALPAPILPLLLRHHHHRRHTFISRNQAGKFLPPVSPRPSPCSWQGGYGVGWAFPSSGHGFGGFRRGGTDEDCIHVYISRLNHDTHAPVMIYWTSSSLKFPREMQNGLGVVFFFFFSVPFKFLLW